MLAEKKSGFGGPLFHSDQFPTPPIVGPWGSVAFFRLVDLSCYVSCRRQLEAKIPEPFNVVPVLGSTIYIS